jgi:hypothetical protein
VGGLGKDGEARKKNCFSREAATGGSGHRGRSKAWEGGRSPQEELTKKPKNRAQEVFWSVHISRNPITVESSAKNADLVEEFPNKLMTAVMSFGGGSS